MRPESPKLFENFSEKSLLDLDQEKAAGRKIAGIYCIFAPSELIFAAGAVPVGLCGKREEPLRWCRIFSMSGSVRLFSRFARTIRHRTRSRSGPVSRLFWR